MYYLKIMDFLKKLKTVNNLCKIRRDQLEKFDTVCQQMKNYLNECPKEICNFFINSTRINKKQSCKVYDGGILEYYNNVDQNLDEKKQELEQLERIFSSANPCQKLKLYLIEQTTCL